MINIECQQTASDNIQFIKSETFLEIVNEIN